MLPVLAFLLEIYSHGLSSRSKISSSKELSSSTHSNILTLIPHLTAAGLSSPTGSMETDFVLLTSEKTRAS